MKVTYKYTRQNGKEHLVYHLTREREFHALLAHGDPMQLDPGWVIRRIEALGNVTTQEAARLFKEAEEE